jgi:hypothetical protein
VIELDTPMLSFFLTFLRLIQAVERQWRDPEFRNVAIMLLSLIGVGTIFYATVEGWHWFDALYFTVITLATVGYGDFAPTTIYGKAFTIVYLIVGLGLFVALIRYVAEGVLARRREKNGIERGDDDPAQ